MEIITTAHHFKIVFRYAPHIIEAVKKLPGRSYNPADKCWQVPKEYMREVEKFAHLYRFSWGPVENEVQQNYDIAPLPPLEMDIPLKIKLRNYQEGAVAYNLLHKKVIIGDDMGLGKTLIAIASIIGADILFQEGKSEPVFPCLIVCPSSVKYNWQAKIEEYTGKQNAMILSDANRKNWQLYFEANMTKWFIVNYESLKKYFVRSIDEYFDATGKKKPLRLDHIRFDERHLIFKSMIIDESHRVKDLKTQQTKFCRGLSTAKNYVFELTGTPVINKPKDLISQLGIIEAMKFFGGYSHFVKHFCGGTREASNLKELNYLLNKNCFYRRSKQEVAKELPAKTRQIVLCDITNRKEYDDAERDLVNYLKQYKDASDDKIQSAIRGQVMVQIGILKNISARGKLKDVKEYLDDVVEAGDKVGVFVHLKEVAEIVKKHYHTCCTITGEDKLEERQNSIVRFRNDDKCRIAVLSIKAAGTGVDGLQYASSLAAFIEQPWTAADCDQAEDRFNRMGQTKPVNCIYFLGRNTIDEHIYKIIETKRDIANTITGNTDEVKVDFVNEFANLFNK